MLRFLALALFALTPPALAQQVWTVSPTTSGVDFPDIQTAVDAASQGDVILVGAHNGYGDFVINGKSLAVVASPGAFVRVRGASVRGLGPDQRVVLSNLQLEGGFEAGLSIKNSEGHVWIQDCAMRGAKGDGLFSLGADQHPEGHPGLELMHAGTVSVVRSVMTGGEGDSYSFVSSPGNGGPGLSAIGTPAVTVQDSVLRGGRGGNIDDDDAAWDGPMGGPGVLFGNADVTLMDVRLVGGMGGIGGEDFDPFLGYSCGWGGAGGAGVQETFLSPGGTVRVANVMITPGAGGPAYTGASCPSGAAGVSYSLIAGNVLAFDAGVFTAGIAQPVVEGGSLQVDLAGPANSIGFIAVGAGPTQLPLPGWNGNLLIDPTKLFIQSAGSLPGALMLTAPQVTTPGGARGFYAQVGGFDFATNALTLSQPIWAGVLDAGVLVP